MKESCQNTRIYYLRHSLLTVSIFSCHHNDADDADDEDHDEDNDVEYGAIADW
jgi:hypothetical protein